VSSSPHRRLGGGRIVRVPVGLGCLVALVALPLAVLAGLVTVLRAMLRPASRRAASAPASAAGAAGAETALCEFVRKMSLDDEFDEDDARTAGLPLDSGTSVDGLLADGIARGWIRRRGGGWAVTETGRAEAAEHLRRCGL